MGLTRFWNTQTHTHGRGKLYMPFRHFMGGGGGGGGGGGHKKSVVVILL